MTSLPNTAYLPTTPSEKFHRHRRSAAMSGDFDNYGLGLFSPAHQPSDSFNDMDVTYNFNNDEDFNKSTSFSFPNKHTSADTLQAPTTFHSHSRSLSLDVSSPPRGFSSPKRNLTSPIRLMKKKSSCLSTPTNKFFLTEETKLNDDNIPDAVIDLDDVLHANLHIGSDFTRKEQDFLSYDDDFLSSPFTKASSPRFSPMVLPYQTLLQQPIRETNDDIAEDGEDDDITVDNSNTLTKTLQFDNDISEDMRATGAFTPPNLNEIYSNSSANSSTSSLKSGVRNKLIEKTASNSSRDSTHSNHTTVNTTPKRSGAKANRYKSIYDQSYKVASALKVNASESINMIKPVKPVSKETRSLGHSASLPSLKPRHNPKYIPRYPDARFNKLSPPPSIGIANHLSNTSGQPSSPHGIAGVKSSAATPISTPSQPVYSAHSSSPTALPHKLRIESPVKPGSSNSPVSITSDIESTVISASGTIQSTDYSSLASHELRPDLCMPSIIISNEEARTPTHSSNSGETETVHNTPTLVSEDKFTTSTNSVTLSPKKEPRRPMTAAEKKILEQTEIPPYRKSPVKHTKAKSMSIMHELTPKLSKSSHFEDSASMKATKRSRFLGWFKKVR